MVKIKICGMTNLDDCRAAVDLGVDFIGFVFYRQSKRYVAPETVRDIVEKLGRAVKTVGVFVEETAPEIERLRDLCGLDFAQVYNLQEAARMRDKARRITVYRVGDAVPEVDAEGIILFDSHSQGFGGSGASFDLGLITDHHALERAFIAGGVTEENVLETLRLAPFGIDLVSAVEAEKGKKDREKMKSFVKKVRSFAQ